MKHCTASGLLRERMQDLYERGSDAGARLGDAMESAGGTLQRQLLPVGAAVREYPLSSVLVAVGIGAVLGALFLRR